ncbi:hypothetical protein [Polycladomyces subterraneus]|uniref:Uncharacterized protein n=1 Tax=Polycladomyces subterraneus TaxID=1016997 RepID=A0ABT8IQV6_9BACL|nr:hypothetical protein [Polycladomyces subterraneus]MDN4595120.1 hypothetical protein [Polycladomyces subterraneus]
MLVDTHETHPIDHSGGFCRNVGGPSSPQRQPGNPYGLDGDHDGVVCVQLISMVDFNRVDSADLTRSIHEILNKIKKGWQFLV